jgi:KDO2-lipid IV(A) lauroyltransferase
VHVQPLGTELPPDPQAAATVINQAMEQVIASCPQQYLWGYARYKQPRQEKL